MLGTLSRRAFSRSWNTVVLSKPLRPQIRWQTSGPLPTGPIPTSESAEQARKAAVRKHFDLQKDWDAKEITYCELKPMTENPTSDVYLIDVREPDEVIQGMIPSAVNLPLSELATSLHMDRAAFLEKHGFEKPFSNQQLIFYCRSGIRSTSASDVAKRNGFSQILNYKGSWLEWIEKENKP